MTAPIFRPYSKLPIGEATVPLVGGERPTVGVVRADWMTRELGKIEGSLRAATNFALTVYNVLDFGADPTGARDSGPALLGALRAIAAAGGGVLYVPYGTFVVRSWATVTMAVPLTMFGGGTLTYAGIAQTPLLTMTANIELAGLVFDGWQRVISNPTGTTGTLDWVRVTGCRFRNAADATTITTNFCQQVLLQNPVSNVLIADNGFENGLYAAFEIGDNVYADQDDWQKIVVRNNTVDGIAMSGSTPAIGYGFLIYGRDAVIDGNDVSNIEGQIVTSSTSNGASGIYTKCRWARIVNNATRDIGLTTDPSTERGGIVGIHVKGSDRAGSSSPQGYNTIVAHNTVQDIGASNTKGYGIALQHSDVICTENIIEEAGRIGISYADQASAVGSTIIAQNTILQASGTDFAGIDVVPLLSKTRVSDNIVNCPGDCIRVRTVSGNGANVAVHDNTTKTGIAVIFQADTYTLTNLSVQGHQMESGAYGCYFGTASGGTISDVMVTGSDFSAASTLPISGTGGAIPATAYIRDVVGYSQIQTATTTHAVTQASLTTLGNATGGAFEVDLPAAANVPGQAFVVKKIDASVNAVTVDADGSDLIDGAANYPLALQWQSVTVQSNGTAWYVL